MTEGIPPPQNAVDPTAELAAGAAALEAELLDVLDDKGHATGEALPRGEVHRRGLWHRAVHTWVFAESGAQLLLQRRAAHKESWGDMWDVSSAGHVTTGCSSLLTAQREMEEELGLSLPETAFQWLFQDTFQSVLKGGTYINNEFSDVYLITVPEPLPLSAFTLQESEVAEVKWVPWRDYKASLHARDPHYVPFDVESPNGYRQLFTHLETLSASSVAASSLHLSCSTRQSAFASLASPAPSAHPAALAALSSLAASRRTASLPVPALAAPRQHRPSRARWAVRVMASQSEKRALISVSDKTGLDTLAKGLLDLGFTLVSTGGTAKAIEEAGLPVTTVDQITNFPEMLDGRVKTLHPAVHGGILARRGLPAHMDALAAHNIGPIDVVAVNLYPFVATVTAQGGASLEKGIENIDIGGPTMIRAAAKNHENVWVVVDPADYPSLLAALKGGKAEGEGEGEEALRRRLAWKAFQHTASYDAAVSEWLWPHAQPKTDEFAPPPALAVPLSLSAVLRYGENPHQRAAFYADDSLGERGKGGIGTAVQHHGKEMSYNNYLDADAAWQCVWEMPTAACVVVKHTNPCGAATVTLPASASPEEQEAALLEAYRAAVRADPVSAFGGIVAFNRPVTAALARELREFRSPTDGETRMFYEIVAAPGYTEEGLAVLKGKSKALRILQAQASSTGRRSLRQVGGGWLLQDSDDVDAADLTLTVVTKKQPSEADLENARFAWRVVKHVKSNAITIAKDGRLLGMGSGQPNRVKSGQIALEKAGDEAKGAAVASDAFFPFAWGDAVEAACEAGVSVIIQPGGSVRDQDAIDCCDKYGVAMVFTNVRHFRH